MRCGPGGTPHGYSASWSPVALLTLVAYECAGLGNVLGAFRNQEPKRARSIRTLCLPRFVIDVLTAERLAQIKRFIPISKGRPTPEKPVFDCVACRVPLTTEPRSLPNTPDIRPTYARLAKRALGKRLSTGFLRRSRTNASTN